MPTYISILRGINVSGQKKIKMADLKQHYEDLGLTDVLTYIQSGNVIFRSDKTPDVLTQLITNKIQEVYGFDVPVIIRTNNELKEILARNIFLNERNEDKSQLYITFVENEVDSEKLMAIDREKFLPDEFLLHDKEIYLYLPNGAGRTKLSNNFFENKLKITATTRNLKTVNKLIELSNEYK